MTPEAAALAEIAARAYRHGTPWTARGIADTLAGPQALVVHVSGGFALGRVIVPEAELFALAVLPERQRRGAGGRLLGRFEAEAAARGALQVLLEVAEANAPARAFYAARGYAETGRRPGYYPAAQGGRQDAVLMARALP